MRWLNGNVVTIITTLQLLNIYIYIYEKKMKQSPSKLDTQNQMDRFSTSKSIVDEKDILKYFMRFDIIPCDNGGARISIQGGQDQKSILKKKNQKQKTITTISVIQKLIIRKLQLDI